MSRSRGSPASVEASGVPMSPSGEELVAACPEAWCRIAAISAPASAASQLEDGGTVGHFPSFVSAGPAATHGADSTIVRNGALALVAHMAWAHRFEAAETVAAGGSQRGRNPDWEKNAIGMGGVHSSRPGGQAPDSPARRDRPPINRLYLIGADTPIPLL